MFVTDSSIDLYHSTMEEEIVRFSPKDLDKMDESQLRNLLSKNDLDAGGDREILLKRFKTFLEQLEIEENVSELQFNNVDLNEKLNVLTEDLESAVRQRNWTRAQAQWSKLELKREKLILKLESSAFAFDFNPSEAWNVQPF